MDPAQMSDEELQATMDKATAGDLEETPTNEEAPVAPPAEAPVEEAPKEEEPEEEQPPAPEQGEEAPPMSGRKAKRLEKLEGLVQRLKSEEAPVPKAEGINYRDLIEADDTVIKDLETKSQEYGQNQYNAGLEQAKSIQFHTRLEIDAPRVETKYPVFDKSSEEFNPVVASSINEWYLATVGYDAKTDTVQNPRLRYGDFVEGIMELADNMAGEKTAQTTQNIAKQAANTGLRPDGSSAKALDLNKAPEKMTDEELQAAMDAALPERDTRGRFLKTR